MKRNFRKTVNVMMLTVLLLLSFVFCLPVSAEKNTVSREIAIVFDNSGSMYETDAPQNKPTDAWCRATYAMEVFASMLNDGDTLRIVPMHPITVGKQTYSGNNPLTIQNASDASILRKIYTPKAGGTPMSSLDNAHSQLMRSSADEKWMVVLTDGDRFDDKKTKKDLETKINGYLNSENVLYLGIKTGGNPIIPSCNSGSHLFGAYQASDSSQVLSKLTEMSQRIFGRNQLTVQGNKIKFDVSMSKLFLFVQGSNLNSISLIDSSGKEVSPAGPAQTLKYSDKGDGTYKFKVDKNLQGLIISYDDCAVGEYTIKTNGKVTSTGAYYEPDVDLVVELLDKNGQVITEENAKKAVAGEYTINTYMKDAKTGKKTDSSLLGDVSYEITTNINGTEKKCKPGEKFQLNEGDVIDADVTVRYLKDYTIKKDGDDFHWPDGGFSIGAVDGGNLDVKISGEQKDYKLSQIEEGKPFAAKVYYKGKLLTGEELQKAVLDIENPQGIKFETEVQSDCILLKPKYEDPENKASVECGSKEFKVNARYKAINEKEVKASSDPQEFTVVNDVEEFVAKFENKKVTGTARELQKKDVFVTLKMGKNPLTKEQMESLVAKVSVLNDTDSVDCRYELDAKNSRIKVILPTDLKQGKYDLFVEATTKNKIGADVTAEDTIPLNVNLMPGWFWLMIGILIALLLALLIWFYLSRKVLPLQIYLNQMDLEYKVKKPIPDDWDSPNYNRKEGRLTITSPTPEGAGLGDQTFTITFDFEPNITRGRYLLHKITKGRCGGQLSVLCTGATIDGNVLKADVEGNTLYANGKPVDDFTPFEFIHDYSELEINGLDKVKRIASSVRLKLLMQCHKS